MTIIHLQKGKCNYDKIMYFFLTFCVNCYKNKKKYATVYMLCEELKIIIFSKILWYFYNCILYFSLICYVLEVFYLNYIIVF